MTRKRVPLGNFVTEYSVRNKNNEDIPVYSVTNRQGFCREYFGKEVASKDKATYKIVPYGYFAYNPSRINVGSVDWQRCETQVIVSPLYNVFSVSDELDSQFLYYFLKSNVGRQMIRAKAAGSVRDNLKLDMLKEITIPESSLNDQRHCAATLDNLQYLIELRKKQLVELDNLIKARFVEMFGDPVKNSKRLPTVLGETLFRLSNGKALPSNERFPEGIPAYGGNGVSWYTDKILCDFDTIIVGRVGFQSGNVHLAKAPLWVTDNAMYISSLNTEICDMRFLCALMEHIDFTRYQDAGDLKKITQKPFMQMHYPMPSMQSQMQYIDFSEQIDKSKVVEAIYKANTLFNITLNGGNRYDIRANEFQTDKSAGG